MRALIVEDEKKVAALIEAGFQEHGLDAEVCHDGDTGWELIARKAFDVLILDIMIPGRDGLSLLRKLRESGNSVPVVLLTARGDVGERIEGLNLGADDYLAKPFAISELVARVRAILRRRTSSEVSVLSFADASLNLATRAVERSGTPIELTHREFALLECLMRTPGRVVTRVEISRQVWRHQIDAGSNFVDVAVQRLRRKFDDPFPRKLIQTVRGVGYALQAEES